MKPHKHCEVIKAWADGAEIEYRSSAGREWRRTGDPMWSPAYEYRVKPQTIKYRVALFEDGTQSWTNCYNTEPGNIAAESSEAFVKWLTDWIEVEV